MRSLRRPPILEDGAFFAKKLRRRAYFLALGVLCLCAASGGYLFLRPLPEPPPVKPAPVAPIAAKPEASRAEPDLSAPSSAGEPMGDESDTDGKDEPLAPLPSYDDLVQKKDAQTALTASGVPSAAGDAQEVRGSVHKGETMTTSLQNAGLNAQAVKSITAALKGVFDFKKSRQGNAWEARFNIKGELDAFTYHLKPLESYYVRREGDAYRGYKMTGTTEMFVVPVAGRIESSLSNAMAKLGEGDQLTQLIADIFAWDIDFFSDLQRGDEFRVMVEKHFYKGKFIRYGRILCASFNGQTIGKKYAYYFQIQGVNGEQYFDERGYSLMKSFLRAPLDTLKVTSSFGFRDHPILHRGRMHNGVDYGAPTGTPTWAIASGRVLQAGGMGGCGLGVKIQHDNGYTSLYCHLSSIAVRAGQNLHQKQLVGRVGATGLATGPHLHFGLSKDGKWLNPLKVKYEPGKPVPQAALDRFKEARALLKGKLDAIEVQEIYGPELPPDWVDPTPRVPVVVEKEAPKAPMGGPAPARNRGGTSARRPRPQGIHRAN